MKKYLYIALISLISINFAFAQNSVDVLRYSRTNVGGTARSMAHGGAFGAVGADFSSLSINPAGIGLYKKSELSLTPTFYLSNVDADLNGHKGFDHKNNFSMNNYGLVLVSGNNQKKGWKFFQFGVGVNRLADFNHRYTITNENTTSSLISDYQIKAYGQHPDDLDPFSTNLAWYNYLLEDTVRLPNGALAYKSPLADGGAYQEMNKHTWGSINEMVLSFGSTYNDIFYIGGSVGFPFLRYYEETSYMEEDRADTITNFYKFIKDDYLETHGSGVNFKFGVIVRPTGWIRMGLAFHSPTWYSMNDYWTAEMVRYYDNGTNDSKESKRPKPDGRYDYNLKTPMKLVGSAAFTIARFLLLSGDVEYIDYSSGTLDAHDYRFNEENEQVRKKYQSTLNIKTGAEIRLRPISFRAGLDYFGNPYANDVNDGQIWKLSGGIGYRDRDFFMDFAYVYTIKKEDYYMYNPDLIDPANLNIFTHQIALSVGYKF
jgi:hypothetical protein